MATILVAGSPVSLRADEASDTVAREAARAAAETLAKEAARSWANAQVSGAKIGAGTAVLGAVDLALAVNDFANATTDRGRLHASLRAGSAGYVLAAGPYAPIVAVAVVVVIGLDDALGARNAARLLEIYRQIELSQKRIIEIKTRLATVDALSFDQLVSQLQEDLAVTAQARQGMENSCRQAGKIKTLDQLNDCIFWVASFYSHARDFVSVSDQLLAWDSELISPDAIYAAAKIKRADISEAKTAFSKALASADQQEKALMDAYARMSFDLLLNKTLDSPTFSTNEYLSNSCVDAATALNGETENFLLQSFSFDQSRATKLSRAAFRARASKLLQALTMLQGSACSKYAAVNKSAGAKLVSQWLTHVATNSSLLRNALVEVKR